MPPVRGRGSPLCSGFGSTEHLESGPRGQRLEVLPTWAVFYVFSRNWIHLPKIERSFALSRQAKRVILSERSKRRISFRKPETRWFAPFSMIGKILTRLSRG